MDWCSDVCSSDLLVRAIRKTDAWIACAGDNARAWRYFALMIVRVLVRRASFAIGAAMLASSSLAQSTADASSPAPIGNPADWFPADAYPPAAKASGAEGRTGFAVDIDARSEEHTSELQSLLRLSYAVFCLKKKN